MVITRDEIIATSETALINFNYKKATNKIDHYHILYTVLLVTSLLLEIGAICYYYSKQKEILPYCY